jgi:capsular polysaccharide transport system permease protein
VLPVMVATVYYTFIATHQYVSEFRFSVKDSSQNAGAALAAANMLTQIGGGSSASSSDNFVVVDFLTSRGAVDELRKRINVTAFYAKDSVDWWSRFDASSPIENFLPYWQRMVTSSYDQVTGIAIAKVRAFSAQDAFLIASSLVSLSEELVNELANRSLNDAVTFAQREVDRAEARLKAIRVKLTEFRGRVGVIDPATSVVASNSTLIQTLRSNLANLETQLATLKLQNLHATSPVIVSLQHQIRSTKEQLQVIEGTVGKEGEGAALSSVVAEFEQLDLERQFAQTMLASATQALDNARARAAAQQLYITPYVRPSVPQSATYPQVLLSIATVAGLALAFWLILLMIVRSVRERFA